MMRWVFFIIFVPLIDQAINLLINHLGNSQLLLVHISTGLHDEVILSVSSS